jgi:hypothetical protein
MREHPLFTRVTGDLFKSKKIMCLCLILIICAAFLEIVQTPTSLAKENFIGIASTELSIDLYNQKGGYGPSEPSEDFAAGETVELTALLTYGDPVEYKLVGFEVRNAQGEIVLIRSNLTDANGLAGINFTIRGDCLPEIFGIWTTFAIASVSEKTVNDTLTFKVSGPFLDIYTQHPEPYSGKGLHQPSDAFAPQEEVILYGEAHYNCQRIEYKFVAFEVKDPLGQTIAYRMNATDENGIAVTSFRLGSNATFGIYTVYGTVEILGKVANDTLTFRVGWIVEILSVNIVNASGTPQSVFARSEYVCFNITAKNIAFFSKIATFTVVVYDENGVPIGRIVLSGWTIRSGTFVIFLLSIQIPTWAYIGGAVVYTNAYTHLPVTSGVPYCPEVSAIFTITP